MTAPTIARGRWFGFPAFWLPIRTKITLPFLILALTLALGAAYVVTQIVFDTIEERYTNQLIESGTLAASWMVREEEHRLETLRLLAFSDGLAEAVRNEDIERVRDLSFGIVLDNREEAVEILNDQGKLLLAIRHRGSQLPEDYEFQQQGDYTFLQYEFVKNVINQHADHIGDKFSGYARLPWGSYFYIAGPLYATDGELAGVILVGKKLSSLVTSMRQQTLTHITLYDFSGQPIVSTFLEPPPIAETMAGDLLEKQDQISLRRPVTEQHRGLKVGDIEYDEVISTWEARHGSDLGLMGSALAKAFLINASNYTRVQITGLVFLAFVLVIFLGIFVANLITRPLIRLVQASLKVADGNLQVQVDTSSNDEVAILTNSFNQMVRSLYKSKQDLIEAYDRALEGWSKALELRDKETEGHTQRVTALTLELAEQMQYDKNQMDDLRRGALLHDIGKMGIPDAVLHKPGPLSEEEWVIMRRHPEIAYEMLSKISFLENALDIPYCHHEKWNGTGYPRQLNGEDIPLAARIFAVIDVYDAITSDRPYHKAMSTEEALEIIKGSRGTHFDPLIVDNFLVLLGERENN